jgi:hypothetical protein
MAYVKANNDAIGTNAATSANSVATYPNAVIAGNLLLCVAGNKTATTQLTLTDNLGATWTNLIWDNTAASGQGVGLYAKIAVGGETSVSTNGAALVNSTSTLAHEYSGNQATLTGIIDASGATGNNTTVATTSGGQPSITTTNANDLLITAALLSAGGGSNPSWTGATALIQLPNTTAWLIADAHQIETSTGTFNPSVSWTTVRKFQQLTVALKPASGVVSASITQVAATITATGGTQSIATVNNVSISQIAATITASGGTQSVATVNNVSISQVGATITASGGTQAVSTSNFVAISQVGATVTATGGTQSLSAMVDATIAQLAANVTASGGTQAVSTSTGVTNVSIAQLAASLTATGGTQIISTSTGPLPRTKPKSVIFLTDGRLAVKLAASVYMPL